MRFNLSYLLLVLLLTPYYGLGQKEYYVEISTSEELVFEWGFGVNIAYDSSEIVRTLNKGIFELQQDNYLLANLDSINFYDDKCLAFIHIGPQITPGQIRLDSNSMEWVSQSLWENQNKVIDSVFFTSFLKQTQNKLINNGYPFASIQLEDIDIMEDKLNATLVLNKREYIVYDTLSRQGEKFISKNYLSNYLNIKEGQPYSHKEFLLLKNRINQSGFIKLENDPWITFIKNKAVVKLPIKAEKSNNFDFLIGILPNTNNGQRRFNINGQAYLDLLNKLGQGERITIDFKRLSEEDQFLSLQLAYPYIAGLSVGANGLFELRRNRDISLDLNTNFGGQYIISGLDYVKAFGVYKSSSLVNIDTTALLNTGNLPVNLDYRYRGGGIGINRQNFDYRFNPSSGWQLYFDVNFGQRNIIENQSILNLRNDQVDFSSAYDSIQETTFQLNLNINTSYYHRLFDRGVFKLGFVGGFRYNDGIILENELYRIGGNKLLRGFDEQTLFTDAFGVMTTEFRFILDQNSYFSFPFIDISRLRTYTFNNPEWNTAIGVGLGLNFATQAGIFNVAFAAGKYNDTPFDFNNTKVHFGFVSVF